MRSLRQTGKRRLPKQTDSQHECETEIIHRLNIPRPPCQARLTPISLPSLPPGPQAKAPKTRYIRLGPIPPWEASVTCSSAPHGHRRRAAASCPGREALATAAAATRPPSLPPSVALPPSLARCRWRGPPAGNLLWTKSRYLRKKKERTAYIGRGEKDHNCIYFHALIIGLILV